jgi:signal transduction histidine kinase
LNVTDPTLPPSDDVLIALNRSATVARLLSSAVHEVNNALQVISGTVEILETRPNIDPALARSLERLRTQSARAAGALADVLVFTKAPIDESVAVNMRDIATHSIALRAFAIKRAGLSIRLDADESTPFIVRGNRGRLQQALLNVIVNAEQALAGSRGAISVTLTADDQSVMVTVGDEGSGVTLDPPAQAFERFTSTRSPHECAGLGLWVSRVIAAAHGGTLTMERRPPGTVFVMTIPKR